LSRFHGLVDPDSLSDALIVRGRYLLDGSIELDGSILDDGAVLVRGDTIEAVGSFAGVRRGAPSARVVGRETDLVIPGFVNSHSHGWGLSSLQLGAPDDRLEPWLIDLISVAPVDPYFDTLHSAMKLVRSGVTSVQHSGFTRDPAAFEAETRAALNAYQDLGMRVLYAVQVRDQNSYAYQDDTTFLSTLPEGLRARVRAAEESWGIASPEEAFELVATLAGEYAESEIVALAICAEGPEWCSRSLLERVRTVADTLAIRIHMHCLESPTQRAYLEVELGGSVFGYLDSIGLLDQRTSIAHAVWMSPEDIRLCASRGVVVCHCPSSNLRLRNGILPLHVLMSAGVTVGLGLDSGALNDDDDFLQELRLAARLHGLPRGTTFDPAPTAADIVALATRNSAQAIGRGHDTGRLAPGLKADIVTIDLERASLPFTSDAVSPLDLLVYRAKREHVRDVVINGQVVLVDGQFERINEQDVIDGLRLSALSGRSQRSTHWRSAMAELRPYAQAFFDSTTWPHPSGLPSYVPNAPLRES
jgi:5-methylthioadenosine/S-adenosylhomocysteine deaminase